MGPAIIQRISSVLSLSNFTKIFGVCAVYIACGLIGLRFASINPSATAVWLPTAVAFTSFLIFGYRVWPAIFLGAFIVNITTIDAPAVSFFIAVGNTLEGFLGSYLVNELAGGTRVFNKTRNFFLFVLFSVLLSTMVSATIGVTSLALGGLAAWADYLPVWITWWLGDATGALIFTPALLLWAKQPKIGLNLEKAIEFLIIADIMFLVGLVITDNSFSFSYLVIPVLIWILLRFGPRETATFTALFSLAMVVSAASGIYSLKNYSPNAALIFVQVFVAVINLSVLPISILINEEKKAKLKREQAISVVNSVDGAIIGKTLDGIITYWNKGAEKLYGYNAFEVMGKNINIIVPEGKREELVQELISVKQGIRIENLETERVDKYGNRLDVIMTHSPILSVEGSTIGVSTITFNITEQKKLEYITKQEEEKEAEKLRKEFIINAAHEFRTPLAVIRGNIDVGLKPNIKKSIDLKSTVNVIEDEVKHLANIIDNLTILSDLSNNSNKTKIGYKKVILADLIQKEAKKYKKDNKNKDFSFHFGNLDREAIWGEESSLNKLFCNIMDNSIAYSIDNLEIHISIEKKGDRLEVFISDNGIGMSESDLSHIFEEFYRSDKSRTNEQGRIGLGLTLVKSVVEAHGGSIGAESSLGKGTTFIISFPIIT